MSKWGRSPAISLIELCFDGLLLLCFILQAFLLGCLFAYGHLPLPAYWLNQNISRQLPPGLSIKAQSYALTLDGTLRLRNLELHLEDIEGAVFLADDADAVFGLQWNLRQAFYLRECILLNGLLFIPAVYSPDGSDRAVLEKIALRLLPVEDGLSLKSFAAQHEDIRLRGGVDWSRAGKTATTSIRERADTLFKQLAGLLKQREKIAGLDRPTLFFKIDARDDLPIQIETSVSTRSYQHPAFKATNLRLDARLELEGHSLSNPSSISLRADAIELPDYRTQASGIRARLEHQDWAVLIDGKWPAMKVVADSLEIADLKLQTSQIQLRSQAHPDLAFSGLTSGSVGAAEFSGSLNLESKAAQVRAAGNLDLRTLAPEKILAHLPRFASKSPPYYNLSVNFAEDFTLHTADLRVRVDGLEVDDISFDHIRLLGNYRDGIYSIKQCGLRRGWQWLDLGFHLDTESQDYALTLKGFAKPDDYNAILPRWWRGIFRDFDFSTIENGLGDFVIYGSIGKKASGFFFGHAAAKNVRYKGVQMDAGELFVRGHGPYAEVHRLQVRSGVGFVQGDLRFASRLDEVRGPMSVRLDLDAKLPVSDMKKIFDQDIARILDDFESKALPRIQVRGAIFNNDYPEFAGLSWIDLRANCPAPLVYKGLPLESLGFELKGRPNITYLREINLGFAGGKAQAQADILSGGETPAKTRFRISLKNADPELAIARIQSLKDPANQAVTEERTLEAGRLDLELHAQAPVNGLAGMRGRGTFQLQDDALYAIQLFGPLSKLLQDTRLGFTSFALDTMEGTFSLENKVIRFDPIEVKGPQSRIEARGNMGLENNKLDMRVSVFLFGNAGNPDSTLRQISDFIRRPIPNILEFELSGTPENQSWRSLYDPRNLLPDYKNFLPDYRDFIPLF